MKNIDIVSVLFSSVVYLVMYIIWYSKFFFGKIYDKFLAQNIAKTFLNYFLVFLCTFVITYILALFEILLGITTFWDGVFFGFLIWAVVAFHSIFLVISFKRNLKLFFIDNLLYLLAIVMICGILAG